MKKVSLILATLLAATTYSYGEITQEERLQYQKECNAGNQRSCIIIATIGKPKYNTEKYDNYGNEKKEKSFLDKVFD